MTNSKGSLDEADFLVSQDKEDIPILTKPNVGDIKLSSSTDSSVGDKDLNTMFFDMGSTTINSNMTNNDSIPSIPLTVPAPESVAPTPVTLPGVVPLFTAKPSFTFGMRNEGEDKANENNSNVGVNFALPTFGENSTKPTNLFSFTSSPTNNKNINNTAAKTPLSVKKGKSYHRNIRKASSTKTVVTPGKNLDSSFSRFSPSKHTTGGDVDENNVGDEMDGDDYFDEIHRTTTAFNTQSSERSTSSKNDDAMQIDTESSAIPPAVDDENTQATNKTTFQQNNNSNTTNGHILPTTKINEETANSRVLFPETKLEEESVFTSSSGRFDKKNTKETETKRTIVHDSSEMLALAEDYKVKGNEFYRLTDYVK